jgi:outer membrane protein assembly factor BamB
MTLTFPRGRRRTGTTGKAASGNPSGGNYRPRLGPWAALGATLVLLATLMAGCFPGSPGGSAAPAGWSPVAATEGIVYVGARQGKIQALADNGFDGVQVKWTFSAESSSDTKPAVYNPPAVGDKLLYVSSYDGYLYALERATGKEGETGWHRPQGQATKPLVAGPALDPEQKVVVVGSEDGGLYAYDAKTGAPLPGFPFPTGDKIWSTPVIANGVVYFGSHDHNIYAVSLSNGRELWRFPTGGAVVARPLLFQDMVVVGSFDRNLYALNAKDGTLRWKFQAKNWFWAGAVSDGKTIFAPSMDGNLYALEAGGSRLWAYAMGSSIVATPAVLPRGLVVAGKDGKVSLLDPSPADLGAGRVLSSQFIRDTGVTAPLTTAGTTAGDSVYLGALDGTVRRIQVKDTLNKVWCFNTQGKDGNTQCE